MWFYNFIIVTSLIITVSARASGKPNKGAIGFPEVEENIKFLNKQNRTPVFLPSMCHENELFYPGDQQDDWICDCRPGYLYHPKTDMCWPAFRQGPCEQGHYLVLPKDSVMPVCYINPCKDDNIVMWNGKCETLGSTAPCETSFPPYVLWVNATNIALDCVRINVEKNEPTTRAPPTCPRGCKRSIENKCVPNSQ